MFWTRGDSDPAAVICGPEIEFDVLLYAIFGANGTAVGALYPPANSADTRDTMATIGTHYTFHCSNRRLARAIAAASPSHLWLYHFDHILSFPQAWGPNFTYCDDKVCHGAELPLLFGTADLYYKVSADEEALGKQLRGYWAAFARGMESADGSLTPAGAAQGPAWPAYNEANDAWFQINTAGDGGLQVSPQWEDRYCALWDSLGYGAF